VQIREEAIAQTANRRCFDSRIEQEWQRLAREQQPLTLILCDVDQFKLYNDTYGHQAGDRCLQQIAQALTQTAQRPSDLVARYGGEEFAIILPNVNTNGATHLAQKISAKLREMRISHVSEKKQVTISLGIATIIPSPESTAQLLIAATDRALYAAKSKGRDCYYVAID